MSAEDRRRAETLQREYAEEVAARKGRARLWKNTGAIELGCAAILFALGALLVAILVLLLGLLCFTVAAYYDADPGCEDGD